MSDDGRTIVKLSHPIKLGDGDQVIDELHFRRGRMGDLKGLPLRLEEVSWDALMTVASRMSGQPSAIVERIDEEDAGRVVAVALGFYMRCLAIGPTA